MHKICICKFKKVKLHESKLFVYNIIFAFLKDSQNMWLWEVSENCQLKSTKPIETGPNWLKQGRNWSKTVKTGQNRLKPVKTGKTGRNQSNLVKTGRNRSKLVQTGPNWTKPVQTIPNLRFCFLKTAQHRTLFEETLAGGACFHKRRRRSFQF